MKKIVFCLLLIFLTACDAPRGIRSKSLLGSDVSPATYDQSTDDGDDDSSEYSSSVNIGDVPGYESCNLAYYTSSSDKTDILRVGVCRSTLSLNKFAFKFGYASTPETATCFYPTYRNSSGIVQKIGDQTCVYHSKGEIQYDISVPTYTNLNGSQTFNGLMIVRKTHKEYFDNCMSLSKSYPQADYFLYNTQMVPCSELGTGLTANQVGSYAMCSCWYFDQRIPYLSVEIYDYN